MSYTLQELEEMQRLEKEYQARHPQEDKLGRLLALIEQQQRIIEQMIELCKQGETL